MPRSISEAATLLLQFLYAAPRDVPTSQLKEGPEISASTSLSVHEINDSVAILERSGYVETMNYIGTHPYEFGAVSITPLGRFEIERTRTTPSVTTQGAAPTVRTGGDPIGSPYGFSDDHWELVAQRRNDPTKLYVILGLQFASSHYDSVLLIRQVELMFQRALTDYLSLPAVQQAELVFKTLAAGYGEHLFNEIAADIISADIAVFEVSDLNPNVMIELGVALTWGTRALLLKNQAAARPPADISGHTWVDYTESGVAIADAEHNAKLVRMIQRAVAKKRRI